MTFWYYARKSSIKDDVGVRDPTLVCLFPVQNITKKIKIKEIRIYMFKVKEKSTRKTSITYSKLTIKTPKRR